MKIALLITDNREPYKNYAAPAPWFGTAPEALLQGFAHLPEVEVHVVSCLRAPVKSPEKLAPNIFFHSLLVPKIGWMSTAFQGCVRATRSCLRRLQPHIVHGQGTERDCALCAVWSGFPNVVTIHGNMAELARLFHARWFSYGWLAARLEELTLRRTAGVFCNSAYTEQLVRPRTRRTWCVPNAIREPFLAPPPGPARRSKCLLLNVGVISPRKRQFELLDVAQQLRRQGLDFELQFAGDANPGSPYAAAFLDRVKALAQEGFVRYVGSKPAAELVAAFDSADGLIHFPSEEAFGLVVAEGLARNVKFFGARVGGIADIAAGVPETELFAADDWSGLTEAVARWIRCGFPRPSAGWESMRARYHPDVVARRHVEIYREVLSRR
jgi:glycosyltransferase involved in cell wall biosynthesis